MIGTIAANRKRTPAPPEPLAWATSANVTNIDQGSGTRRLEKTGGGGWSEQGHTTAAIAGEFALKIVLGANMADSAVGITSGSPATSASYTTIDWSLTLSGGVIHVFNRSSSVATFSPNGDPLWIVRDASNAITVREGATLAGAVMKYAIGTDAAAYFGDSSLFTTGAVVDVKMGAASLF